LIDSIRPELIMCMQLLREAASRGGQMAHAAGTSPPPPTAPLGASGAETIKELEARTADPVIFHEPSGMTLILLHLTALLLVD